jgi:hypothetical protein
MSITAPDETAALHEPDWHALEDDLAPICDELAAQYASTYDSDRRRRDFEASLAEIRRRDAAERGAQAAREAAQLQAAVQEAAPALAMEIPGLAPAASPFDF